MTIAWLHAIDPTIMFLSSLVIVAALYPYIEKRVLSAYATITGRSDVALFYLMFAPGVIVHELSHLIAALLLLADVRKFKLFSLPTGPSSQGFTLGYVQHAGAGPVRSALIGIAPLFGNALATYWMLSLATLGAAPFPFPGSVQDIVSALSASFSSFDLGMLARFALFAYVAVACAIGGALSKQDVVQSIPGLAIMAAVATAIAKADAAFKESSIVEAASRIASKALASAASVLMLEAVMLVAIAAVTSIIMSRRRVRTARRM